MRLPGYNMEVDEIIMLASEKIRPIIEMLVETPNSTEHFITSKDCDDLEETSNIIIHVAAALENIGFQTSTNVRHLNLDKYRDNANKEGYIYVDTVLLLEILDLYNILETIQYDIDTFYKSLGIHSFVQTEADLISLASNDSFDLNRIVFKLKKSPSKNISSIALFKNDFIVMPSSTEIMPLKESKSQILESNSANIKKNSSRKSKSTTSMEHEEMSQVTDVYGARKVLVKCICDLNEVSNYLGIPRKDVSTICSRVEVDSKPDVTRERKSISSNKSQYTTNSDQQDVEEISRRNGCCCPKCFADVQEGRMNFKECEEDQVIICIKGCNEAEGDIQIVIRQCPDCKKAGERPTENLNSDKSEQQPSPLSRTFGDNKSLELAPAFASDDTSVDEHHSETHSDKKSVSSEFNDFGAITPSIKSESKSTKSKEHFTDLYADSFLENNVKEVESTALHNKDSKGSPICSDEEDEEKRKESVKLEATYVQNQVSCSRIKLFETTNLCLQTDSGKELVISLTITPKDMVSAPKKLSLADIFSDSDYVQTDDNANESAIQDRVGVNSPERFRRESGPKKSRESYYVSERYIPLERTKVCSSLDFDVTTVKSKIKEKGLQDKNNKILVQLEKFGTENLLRACRPAKCCRRAILNEKMKKCLPYAPSLRSLPLDDKDLDVINQSLQMSLQKVKKSMNLNKDFYSNQANYVVNTLHTVMYFFLENDISGQNMVKQTLSYYINLVNDVHYNNFNRKYDTLYFGVENKRSFQVCSNTGQHTNIKEEENAQLRSNSQKSKKSKFQNYDDMPAISNNITPQNDLFLTKNFKIPSRRPQINTKRISNISRIPVYRGCKASEFNSNNEHKSEDIQEQFYDISCTSLLPNRYDSFLETNTLGKNKKIIPTEQSFDECNAILEYKNVSKYSMTSSVRRCKRKKKEFYLSKSKSEISLNTLKSICKNKNITYLPNIEVTENPSKTFSSEKNGQSTVSSSDLLTNCDSSKIILNYFTKLLLEMIMKQATRGKGIKEFEFLLRPKMDVSVETENLNLQEIYRKLSNKKTNISHISRLGIEISYHELTAKQSQYCLLSEKGQRTTSFCLYDNLALQTSKIFSDNKKCQTSHTLLIGYILNSNAEMQNAIFNKKQIFKKTYNFENTNCLPDSCNEIENFIVTFKSDQSFGSNISDKDLMTSHSYFSRQSSDSTQEETLSQSLLKLKETLEIYENVKSEIANRSLRESNIDPIEYFVYQVCACNNKINKKPASVIQKIFSKTKELFSSTDKDICRKYNNQFSSMSPGGKQLCYSCGCYISKCGSTLPTKKDSNSSDLCQCPPENKKNKKSKNSNSKPAGNLFKIASASTSSLKSIKARIKKSLCEVLRPKNGNSLKPSSGENKNVSTICVSQNTNVIVCDRKSTSTGTTNNCSSQKCACDKCNMFADDGTCCCSHCMGCLDKSFDAKPDNNNVGIATELETSPENLIGSEKTNEASIKSIQNSYNYISLIPATDISIDGENHVEVAATESHSSKRKPEGNDIEIIDTNDTDNSKNTDRTAFFFLTPPPHLFQQFRVADENPFGQYLSNFQPMGMMENSESQPNE